MNNFLFKAAANWPVKVLAVIMALFLYVFQQMNDVTGVSFDIPLTGSENAELVSITPLPAKARLAISGTEADVAAAREHNIRATVDIAAYTKPGVYNVPIKLESAQGARNLDMLNMSVTPSEIKLALDRRAGKYIFVEPALKGEAAPGYALTRYTVTPRQIYLEGPAALVEETGTLRTEIIDITGLNTNLSRTVFVAGVKPPLHIDENNVQVSADIISIEEIKEYTQIAVALENLAPFFAAERANDRGALRVQGNIHLLAGYAPGEQTLALDFAQITKEGLYVMPVIVSVPDGITVLACEPETIAVRVFVNTER